MLFNFARKLMIKKPPRRPKFLNGRKLLNFVLRITVQECELDSTPPRYS
jgi:hypothetical protein